VVTNIAEELAASICGVDRHPEDAHNMTLNVHHYKILRSHELQRTFTTLS